MTDFIKYEEKLIKEKINVSNAIKQSEMLSKLKTVSNKIESKIPEKLSATIKTYEHLSASGEVTVPFKVRGSMLGVGRHRVKFYSEEELKKSVEVNSGKVIPIKLDHRGEEAASTIGMIDRLFWDEATMSVMYEGHINNLAYAMNVNDSATTDVSATILSEKSFSNLFGIIGTGLEYSELSLVEEGAYRGNFIEPAKQ